jgi:hypothetical protein
MQYVENIKKLKEKIINKKKFIKYLLIDQKQSHEPEKYKLIIDKENKILEELQIETNELNALIKYCSFITEIAFVLYYIGNNSSRYSEFIDDFTNWSNLNTNHLVNISKALKSIKKNKTEFLLYIKNMKAIPSFSEIYANFIKIDL